MNKKSESGQAIVLLALAVIGLVGFTALAIDGGMIYADRRQAQSASDASSLAGGGNIALWLDNKHIDFKQFSCSKQIVNDIMNYGVYKARERAEDNDYIDEEIAVSAVCEDSGPLFDKKYIDINTHITTETETSFMQVIYDGPATNQVNSVVRVRPSRSLALGMAIVALNEDICDGNNNGVILGGDNRTIVTGGGIWSNGCMKCDGLKDFSVQVFLGVIGYVGWLEHCNVGDLLPFPVKFPEPLPVSSWSVPIPNCDHPSAEKIDKIDNLFLMKNTIKDNTLYCLENEVNAIKLPSPSINADGVTFYLMNGGDVEITGGDVHLSAPPSDAANPLIPGILFFANPTMESVIKINGNSDSSYTGMIYAPMSDVLIAGTANIPGDDWPVVFNTQIIGLNVHITGNAVVDINFNGNENYPKPAYLDLLD